MVIVIEGLDGSGKQTQTELLCKELQKQLGECRTISFPDYSSKSCEPVNMYLNGELGGLDGLDAYQVNSLYAVNRLCSMQKYLDYVQAGGTLICDRYTTASMLYQSVAIDDKTEKNNFLDYIDNFEFNVLKIPRPDVVIFLKVPVEVSTTLLKNRQTNKSNLENDIFEENKQRLQKIYDNSMFVANKFGWKIIDCCENGKMRSIEAIHNDILKIVNNFKH